MKNKDLVGEVIEVRKQVEELLDKVARDAPFGIIEMKYAASLNALALRRVEDEIIQSDAQEEPDENSVTVVKNLIAQTQIQLKIYRTFFDEAFAARFINSSISQSDCH